MVKIIYSKKLPRKTRKTTNIIKLKGAKVVVPVLLEMASKFGLRASRRIGEITTSLDELTYNEGQYYVSMNRRSGALRYIDTTRWQIDDGKSHVHLSDDEATEIASKFVKKNKLLPLKESTPVKVTRLYAGTMEKAGAEAKERIIDCGVVFQRFIGNIPVYGPGGCAMVYIDYKGKITGFDRTWRNIKNIQKKLSPDDIRSPKYAAKSLKRYWGKVAIEKLMIKNVLFGYFEDGPDERQRNLQPVYFMPMELTTPESRMVMKSFHIVGAARRPVGKIMPKPKRIVEQPVRKQ